VTRTNSTFKFTNADIDVNAATILLDGLGSAIVDQNGANALGDFSDNDGSLTIKADRDLTTTSALTNDGTVDLGANSVLTTTGDYVQAAGSTDLKEATSRLAASGGGALVRVQGGTLRGVGSVDPALNVSGGKVAPGLSAGVLDVAGSYTQGAGGTLEVEIGGATPGTDHDQLDASDTASLGGTLDIKTPGGFTPSPGDSFTILICSATDCRSGEFATVQGANLGGGLEYQVKYNARDVVLEVVDTSTIDTSLTLAASPKTLTFGQTTTLSGQLTKTVGGAGVSGEQVILEHRPAGETDFTQVGNASTTDANGNFSFAKVQRNGNTEYRARFAGDPAAKLNASASNTELVEVKVGLTLKVSRTTVKLGKKAIIFGAVSPAHTGSVQLTIKRGTAVVLTKSVPLDSSSLYKLGYKPKRTGSYSVTANFAADNDHLGNRATAAFKVKR
jgi:hypothetical protein